MKQVYLAGPITGLTFDGAVDWRNHAVAELAKDGIVGLSPMRAKEYLAELGKAHPHRLSGTGEEYSHMGPLSLSRGVMTRDRWDATRADVLLINLLGAEQVSIGTVMELAWADLSRIPTVVVMEKEGNIHEHMMVREAIGFRVETLDEGLDIVRSLLK